MTIVHNNSQEIIVREWKCPYCVIGFTPGSYPEGEPFPFHGHFNVAVVSTYGDDEPLAIILEATRCMPGVDFYFTGDDHGVAQQIKVNKPENCYFTGYLSYARYIDLLRHADAVMDLTTRNDTLLMGGFEAVSLGTPLITSDWPVLKEYFYMGTIHIPNTVNGVCEGVRRCQLEKVLLQKDILILKEELQNDWNRRINELKLILLK